MLVTPALEYLDQAFQTGRLMDARAGTESLLRQTGLNLLCWYQFCHSAKASIMLWTEILSNKMSEKTACHPWVQPQWLTRTKANAFSLSLGKKSNSFPGFLHDKIIYCSNQVPLRRKRKLLIMTVMKTQRLNAREIVLCTDSLITLSMCLLTLLRCIGSSSPSLAFLNFWF